MTADTRIPIARNKGIEGELTKHGRYMNDEEEEIQLVKLSCRHNSNTEQIKKCNLIKLMVKLIVGRISDNFSFTL